MKQDVIVAQEVFDSPRFELRPLRRSDEGLMTLYTSDKRVASMTSSIPHPLPPGSVEAFIAKANATERQEHVWAMDASRFGGSELLGVISLKAPAMWNTGRGSEAVRTLIAANPLANSTIFATVFQDNPASARVLTNAGFDYLGDAESFSVARGHAAPTWTYLKKLA